MFHLAGRVRTVSETSSESGDLVRKVSTGVGYDVDGKFSFTKVRTGILNNIKLYELYFVVSGSNRSCHHYPKDNRGREWEVFLLLR